MFSPFWGLPTTNAMLQHMQREMDQMYQRLDTVFQVMLNANAQISAQTPADTICTEGKLRLLRYRPVVEQPHPVPLVIVPSLITRYYILDLMPGASLAQYLVAQGLDVYLVDWGERGPEDRHVTFDEYIAGMLRRAIQRVRTTARSETVSLLGYSMGGTIAAIWSALYSRYVQNLVLLAAPINFHDASMLSQWTRKDRFNVDLIVDTLGTMPMALMQASFRMLTPAAQIMQQIALADQVGDTDAVRDLLAMQAWFNQMTLFIGEAYRKYIKECYQENYLAQGKLVIHRQRVDLANIHAALLTIAAANDYFCPPESAMRINELVSSVDKQSLELPSGHVGMIVGRAAAEQCWPQLAAWLVSRSGEPASAIQPASVNGTETAPHSEQTSTSPHSTNEPAKPSRQRASSRTVTNSASNGAGTAALKPKRRTAKSREEGRGKSS